MWASLWTSTGVVDLNQAPSGSAVQGPNMTCALPSGLQFETIGLCLLGDACSSRVLDLSRTIDRVIIGSSWSYF